MLVKLTKIYKGVTIEVSQEMQMDSSKTRKNLAQQLVWAEEDIDEKFPLVSNSGIVSDGKLPIYDEEENLEEDHEYLKVTPGQIDYLRKLGVKEERIEKIKSKKEASELITKLNKKGGK